MRTKYIKPAFKVKQLCPRPLLQEGSNVHMGGYGKFDAKACSYDFYEDDFYDDEQ